MKTIHCKHSKKSSGFTIIELLIATLIFSTILTLIAYGFIDLNKAYYKGLTASNTQTVADKIVSDISQDIQFSGSAYTTIAPKPPSVGFCVGSRRYSYLLGWQVVQGIPNAIKHKTNHALISDVGPGNCTIAQNVQSFPVVLPTQDTEMMAPNMRLVKLNITQILPATSNSYLLDVRVAYGDDDLLYSPSSPLNLFGGPGGTIEPDAACKIQAGSQFCDVSEVSTVVKRRIN